MHLFCPLGLILSRIKDIKNPEIHYFFGGSVDFLDTQYLTRGLAWDPGRPAAPNWRVAFLAFLHPEHL